MAQIKYYSFKVGTIRSSPKTWKLQDIKIPANSPKQALIMDQFLKRDCPDNFKANSALICMVYRQIIEFEFSSSVGLARVNYKKLRTYSEYEINTWF